MSTPEPTTWTLHLAAARPARAAVALLVVLFGLFAVAALVPDAWGIGGKAVMLLLAAVLLLGAIAEFLFPVTYTLDARGAHARMPGSYRLLPWERVRRVYLRPDGIQLSPLAARGWAEGFRGVTLRTRERDAVLAAVRAWLDARGVSPVVSEEP